MFATISSKPNHVNWRLQKNDVLIFFSVCNKRHESLFYHPITKHIRYPLVRRVLTFVLFILSNVSGRTQDHPMAKYDFIVQKQPVSEAILHLSEIADVPIVFNSNLFKKNQMVSLNIKSGSVVEILKEILQGGDVHFRIEDELLILYKRIPKTATISGYIQDSITGEHLVLANVWDAISGKGTTTNDYGFFSLTLERGNVELHLSYLGYQSLIISSKLTKSEQSNYFLSPSLTLNEVLITDNINQEFGRFLSGKGIGINSAEILKTPALAGESDLFRHLQNLPGIQSGADGLGGMHVRGGNTDQNLVLLDGVPVYNPSHTLGIFSIFNTQIIKSTRMVKSSFSAKYGGRLSSVIDIRTKEGNTQSLGFMGEIGTVASKGVLEVPILSGKGGILLSLRRTHLDPFIGFISKRNKQKNDEYGKTEYVFHDVNGKIHWNLSNKNRLFLSLYKGGDHYNDWTDFDYEVEDTVGYNYYEQDIGWGNTISSLRWNCLIHDKLFSNTTFTYSFYNYLSQNISYDEYENGVMNTFSDYYTRFVSTIEDWTLKTDFEFYPNHTHHLLFGGGFTWRQFEPGSIEIEDSERQDDLDIDEINESLENVYFPITLNAREVNLYFEDQIKMNQNLTLSMGVHGAAFLTDAKNHFSLQPRINLNWNPIGPFSSNLSFGKMTQFLHVLTSSGSGFPNDLWVPSTRKVKPQNSWQLSLSGASIFDNGWSAKIEAYYKKLDLLTSYQEEATLPSLFENDPEYWEEDITVGSGNTQGIEFQVKCDQNNYSGFLSIDFGKSDRKFTDLNFGKKFPYRYHHSLAISLNLNFRITQKLSFTTGWQYGSGQPFTLVISDQKFAPLDNLSPSPTDRIGSVNGHRLPAYHRLDFTITWKWQPKKWKHQMDLGLYNASNRRNLFFRYWLEDPYFTEHNGIRNQRALPVIPTIKYSFAF